MSYLTDSLTGILKINDELDQVMAERLKEKYEAMNKKGGPAGSPSGRRHRKVLQPDHYAQTNMHIRKSQVYDCEKIHQKIHREGDEP